MNKFREGFRAVIGKVVDLSIKHKKYLLAVVSFILIAVILFSCTDANSNSSDPMSGVYKHYTESSNEELNTLIDSYYNFYVSGDVESLRTLADPISDEEDSFIRFYSQYIDTVEINKIYYKRGIDEDSYIVSAYINMKYYDANVAAPGIDFFYVDTRSDGTLYINNIYGSFNQSNNIYELDSEITTLIAAFEQQDDVLSLYAQVQQEFNDIMLEDESLATLVNATFPSAFAQWNIDYQSAVALAKAEAEAEQAKLEAEAQKAEEAAAKAYEEAQEEANAIWGKTASKVNVRKSADGNSKKLGSIDKNVDVKIYAQEGDFYKIDYEGKRAYVACEYIRVDVNAATQPSTEATGNTDTQPADNNTSTTSNSIAEGTVVTLSNTCNIRKGMSADTDKVATAYQGEKVTVIQSYAEGWTKVKYGKKEGYMKTDLLK